MKKEIVILPVYFFGSWKLYADLSLCGGRHSGGGGGITEASKSVKM